MPVWHDVLTVSILAYYAIALAIFCLYGLHRYHLLWRYARGRAAAPDDHRPVTDDADGDWPAVTVQLPMFNERHVAERVIEAACAIDYPADRLEIQVLDDSTDGTSEIARRCCERMARAGHDVRYLHRTHRTGYKAGALGAGLETARGTFIAIFDADFVPPPDFLRQTVRHFDDESIGMVQARWEHLNRDESLLTRVQATCLDAHFVIEQFARAAGGLWFNFNGTAGIWRRRCIDDAGGWAHDTLTEDCDLSYRAQLRNWRFVFLPHVVCPAELPPTMSALVSQQHRWNKGLVQTAIKLLPTILRSNAPLGTKLEAWFHLTAPLPYVALLLLCLTAAPALWLDPTTSAGGLIAAILGVACLGLGTLAACAYCLAAQIALRRPLVPALGLVAAVMAVGVGVSLVNTRAVFEALMGWHSPFVRTPKFNGRPHSGADPGAGGWPRMPAGIAELILGLLMFGCIVLTAIPATGLTSLVGVPFLALFSCGFLGVGLIRLREWRRAVHLTLKNQPARTMGGRRTRSLAQDHGPSN